jgi:broad specificity phosphatase PhoE
MRLLLARHGETEGNNKGVFLGLIDESLNQNGIIQAEKVALRLKNVGIDIIFSSDLKRAKETTEIINKYHHLNIDLKKELRERNFGIFQGKSKEKLFDIVRRSKIEFHKYKPKNGESCLEVQERIVNFFKKIIENYSDKTVLIVTHGAVIMELLFYLTKLPRNEFRKVEQDKTALNIIKINQDGTIRVELINNTDHLK